MNRRILLPLSSAVAALIVMIGCADDNESFEPSGEKPTAEAGHSFKEGRGVFLTDETIRTLGVRTAEPLEKTLASQLEVTARVYAPGRATVLLDATQAIAVASASGVNIGSPFNTTGTVTHLDRQMEKSLGQIEALIEFDASKHSLQPGDTLPVVFATGPAQPQLVAPATSVLQTGEGSFVFIANGGYFLRSRVRIGVQRDGWTAITDGLLAGDVIVTNGVLP
jgi:hypothetical protein